MVKFIFFIFDMKKRSIINRLNSMGEYYSQVDTSGFQIFYKNIADFFVTNHDEIVKGCLSSHTKWHKGRINSF